MSCPTILCRLTSTIIRPAFHPFRDQLEGRSMLVRRAKMIEVECVARGYVSGSGWKDYRRDGSICGIPLPAGLCGKATGFLSRYSRPATKAQSGHHDENISFRYGRGAVGR